MYEQIDRLLGGTLAERLRTWEKAKVSAPAMARLIHLEIGIEPSGESIRRWLRSGPDRNGDGA